MAWWTVHHILVATAVQALGPAAPTSMIGIDETQVADISMREQANCATITVPLLVTRTARSTHPKDSPSLRRASLAWPPGPGTSAVGHYPPMT
jgi:hypothetical protein